MARWTTAIATALLAGFLLLSAAAAVAQDQSSAVAPEQSPAATITASALQPSYDVLRIEEGGAILPYHVWIDWIPVLVTQPDGGAWAFFSAQAKAGDGYGDRKLFAARFDPKVGNWLPAVPMPGGAVQFGAAAAVDGKGVVHVVYSDRPDESDQSVSVLVYSHSDDGGGWTAPVPVAPDPNAGHQMMPSLAVDRGGGVHLVWRDQRLVTPEARAALPANADVFASDLVDGAWSAPVQVNKRTAPDVNAGWPHLAVDGDRAVAIWSVYQGTTADEMKSAVRVEWSSRPLGEPNEWSAPQTLLDSQGGDTGGRFIDMTGLPTGGVAVVYGRYDRASNDLFLRRLPAGSATWAEPEHLATGDYGYLPAIAAGADGTLFVVFNNGRNRDVDVGAMVMPPNAAPDQPIVLTPAEDGLQARAGIAVATGGAPWVIYMHQPVGSASATEMRTIRAALMAPSS